MRQKDKEGRRIGYISSDKLTKTDNLFIEEIKKAAEVKHIPISHISLLIDNGINLIYEYEDISKFDGIFFRVPKSKYLLAASIIESLPSDIISLHSSKGFSVASSRLNLYRTLSKEGVPTPKIIFSDNPQASMFGLKLLRFPIMIKVPTDKNKVMLANSQQEAKSMVDALQVLEQPLLLEEYYPEARVFHVFVIGDEVVFSFKRIPDEINYSKGKIEKCNVSGKVSRTALKVANILNVDFARVDILDTAEPIVIDVNVTPLIYDFQKADINIVGEVVKHFLSKIESKEKESSILDDIKSVLSPHSKLN
jgi:glutathione synthase/RimK-type ligase-like ATP-grasp enzyme